jgi:hypothetical protein
MATIQPINLRELTRSIERLSALCDALEIITNLQTEPNCSSVSWRILQRVAARLNREIKIESEVI